MNYPDKFITVLTIFQQPISLESVWQFFDALLTTLMITVAYRNYLSSAYLILNFRFFFSLCFSLFFLSYLYILPLSGIRIFFSVNINSPIAGSYMNPLTPWPIESTIIVAEPYRAYPAAIKFRPGCSAACSLKSPDCSGFL